MVTKLLQTLLKVLYKQWCTKTGKCYRANLLKIIHKSLIFLSAALEWLQCALHWAAREARVCSGVSTAAPLLSTLGVSLFIAGCGTPMHFAQSPQVYAKVTSMLHPDCAGQNVTYKHKSKFSAVFFHPIQFLSRTSTT